MQPGVYVKGYFSFLDCAGLWLYAETLMDNHKKAVIYALTACLIWGTVYVAIRVGLAHGWGPLTFAGIRFLLGGVILLAIARAKGVLSFTRRDLWVICLFGLVQTGIQNALFFSGVKLTSAGISAIFINTQPFFVILMAPLFFHSSKITVQRLIGVLIGFGGVFLTAFRHGMVSGSHELGIILLVISAISWAGSNIAVKKILPGRDALTFTGLQMAAGALPLLVVGLIVEGGQGHSADTAGWLVLAYLVIFATSIPFFAWFKALQLGEVGRVSVFSFMLPVLGVVSGWALLGEPVNANIFLGMAMVASGIVIVNWKTG